MDNGVRYPKISKGIVKIYIDTFFFHGFVAECQAHVASVIASAVNFPKSLKRFEVVLVFPDGKKVSAKVSDIEIVGKVAAIECNFSGDGIDTSLVQALNLCIQPLLTSEEIYTYSAYGGTYEGVMTRGFVTELHDNYFLHSCSATTNSQLGALVINKVGELVGLCYGFDRYLTSISVRAILEAFPRRN